MRKWRFTRPVRSGKAMVILAFLLTILAHAVFLLPDYRMPPVNDNPGGTGIQMLNLEMIAPEQRKKFNNWLALHDPSVVSRSTSHAGYTAFWKRKKWLSVDTVAYKPPEIRQEMDIAGFSPLKIKPRSIALLPDFAVPEPPVVRKSEVIVLDSAGKNRRELLGRIPYYSGAVSPTVVQKVRFGGLYTIAVLRSSGNRELDLAAVSAVSGMNTDSRETLTVIWPQEKRK